MTNVNRKLTTRDMAICAMIAALYAALCVALAPISYGVLNVRVAEALTLLPVFSPLCIWGVTLGCALANLVGFMTEVNILGPLDILFGTLATLIAAIMSFRLRHRRLGGLPVLSALPPILINAAVIGLELTYAILGAFEARAFLLNALSVAAGQAAACIVLGLPLVKLLERYGLDKKYFN